MRLKLIIISLFIITGVSCNLMQTPEDSESKAVNQVKSSGVLLIDSEEDQLIEDGRIVYDIYRDGTIQIHGFVSFFGKIHNSTDQDTQKNSWQWLPKWFDTTELGFQLNNLAQINFYKTYRPLSLDLVKSDAYRVEGNIMRGRGGLIIVESVDLENQEATALVELYDTNLIDFINLGYSNARVIAKIDISDTYVRVLSAEAEGTIQDHRLKFNLK